jgi:hypothetical protein
LVWQLRDFKGDEEKPNGGGGGGGGGGGSGVPPWQLAKSAQGMRAAINQRPKEGMILPAEWESESKLLYDIEMSRRRKAGHDLAEDADLGDHDTTAGWRACSASSSSSATSMRRC